MYLSEEIGMIPNMDMETERGTYPRVEAEIDLGAIRDNFAAMRGRLRDDTKMIAVVKTDAYGHGAVRIAEMMEPEAYIWGFAVATTEEAVELRRAGIRKPILCLGFVFPQDYDLLVRLQIRPATFKLSMARQLSEAASRAGMILPVHLAVDTGMGRIGFQVCEEDADEAAEIAKLSNLKVDCLLISHGRMKGTRIIHRSSSGNTAGLSRCWRKEVSASRCAMQPTVHRSWSSPEHTSTRSAPGSPSMASIRLTKLTEI